jgi:hypothetical protein
VTIIDDPYYGRIDSANVPALPRPLRSTCQAMVRCSECGEPCFGIVALIMHADRRTNCGRQPNTRITN